MPAADAYLASSFDCFNGFVEFCVFQFNKHLKHGMMHISCFCHLQDKETLVTMYYDDYDDSVSTSSHYGCDHHCEHAHQHCMAPIICIHPSVAWTSAPLPRDSVHWNSFSKSGWLQCNSLYYLSVRRVINWCPSLGPLYPVFTAGIHLVSTGFQHNLLCRVLYLHSSSCPFFYLSVTCWHCVKTTQARITLSSPTDSPRTSLGGVTCKTYPEIRKSSP